MQTDQMVVFKSNALVFKNNGTLNFKGQKGPLRSLRFLPA